MFTKTAHLNESHAAPNGCHHGHVTGAITFAHAHASGRLHVKKAHSTLF